MTSRPVSFSVGSVKMGGSHPLFVIAGPCVIESRAICLAIARKLAALARETGMPLVFKASYDKANRTSLSGFRGIGLLAGLEVLREVGEVTGLPLLTDVHSPAEATAAARVVDIVQIPAFLCRQTDLLLAAGETGAVVNIKKGQFMAPWDVGPMVEKVVSTGNRRILLTERGASFGYNQLVVDMRSLPIMARTGFPVVFDATHSVQKPGGGGGYTSGDATMAPVLARAAVAAGCNGVFMETHVEPGKAMSDRDNCLPVSRLKKLWKALQEIHTASRKDR